MKTAKAQRTGLVGEGGFIPNAEPAVTALARLKAERDELREALDAIMQSDRSTPFICDALRRQARAVLARTEPK